MALMFAYKRLERGLDMTILLDAMGYTKENLIDGVSVSSADETFTAILASSKVISY